jgi:alanine racemase
MHDESLTWVEVSTKALQENLHTIQSIVPSNTRIAATVKANAYGHGLEETARILKEAGTEWFYVVTAAAAVRLRDAGIDGRILLLSLTDDHAIPRLIEHDIDFLVPSFDYGSTLAQAAESAATTVSVHAMIDTGMSRHGVHFNRTETFVEELRGYSYVDVVGISTHFGTADAPEKRQFQKQLQRFDTIADAAPIAHCGNTAAVLARKEAHFDMIRPGIALYGYYPSEDMEKQTDISFEPALSLQTTVTQTKQLPAGTHISYGATKTLSYPTEIAILPVGYYDGIDRRLSNTGSVIIHGQTAPILGTVCMNSIIIETKDIPAVQRGDTATVIGVDGSAHITAADIAARTNTIPYEVLTNIRSGIPRVYVDK